MEFKSKISIEKKQRKENYFGYKISFIPKYENKGITLLLNKMRHTIWQICNCARKLYSELDESVSKEGDEKVEGESKGPSVQILLNSKLFSGGLAREYFYIFSKEKLRKIKQIVYIYNIYNTYSWKD